MGQDKTGQGRAGQGRTVLSHGIKLSILRRNGHHDIVQYVQSTFGVRT